MPKPYTTEESAEYARQRRLQRPDPPEPTGLAFRPWMTAHYTIHRAGDAIERWEEWAYLGAFADECERAYSSGIAESIVLWKGSQLGFTHLLVGFQAWVVLERHGRVLIVLPQDPIATKFHNGFLEPAANRLDAFKQLVSANENRHAVLGRQKVFDSGASVLCQGGGKADRYRSATTEVTMLDELDGYKVDLDEGDCLSLSIRGIKNRKGLVVAGSTPSSAQGKSQIVDAWMSANRKFVWVVKCPRCGKHTDVAWERMRFNADGDEDSRAASVRQECGRCGDEWFWDELPEALQAGKWQPAESDGERFPTPVWKRPKQGKGPRAGFAINGLCSVWVSWADIVRQWLQSAGDTQKRKAFVEQVLAEPYALQNPDLDPKDIEERLVPVADIPDDYRFHVVALDVQGQGEGGWLIAYEFLVGPRTDEGSYPAVLARRTRFEGRVDTHMAGSAWAAFRQWFASQDCVLAGRAPHAFVCDVGYQRDPGLFSLRAMRFRRKFAVIGRGGWDRPSYERKTTNTAKGAAGINFAYYVVGVDSLKEMTQRDFKAGLWRVADIPGAMDAADELIAEVLTRDVVAGQRRLKWKKVPGLDRNEALDCACYARACLDMVRPVVTAENWPLVTEMAAKPRQKRQRRSALRSGRF